eukprot:TRINITY_DN13854_c0_g1_i1.p1 TRINITY_DN13854_c0_g1~~TRINITY_DN13854_c0_g1_i1.p1  ORF type:complete len:214 (+),score=38.12 TRINITY_DN13854_c0_g1_i1:22-642(+)
MTRHSILCALGALALLLHLTAAAVTIKVEPKQEECFWEDLEQGQMTEVIYNVVDGGLLDAEFKVKKGGFVLFSKMHFEGRDEGKWKYTVQQTGTYGICFNNEMARFTVKTISFDWKTTKAGQQATTSEDLTPMQQALQRISSAIDTLQVEQNYFHVREIVHRNTAESTNGRVRWWSIIESTILVLMAVGQIYYIRRIVDSKTQQRV